MSRSYVIGLDPGATGAAAVFDAESMDFVCLVDTPTEQYTQRNSLGKNVVRKRVSPKGLALALARFAGPRTHVYLEQVWAMPGQGVSSTFAFGEAYGLARGVCTAKGMEVHLVAPRTWLNAFGLGSDKTSHRNAAKALLPRQAALFERVKDDGRADAALLALWGLKRWALMQPKGIGFLPPEVVSADGDEIKF